MQIEVAFERERRVLPGRVERGHEESEAHGGDSGGYGNRHVHSRSSEGGRTTTEEAMRRRPALTATLALTCVLAACGGGSSGDTSAVAGADSADRKSPSTIAATSPGEEIGLRRVRRQRRGTEQRRRRDGVARRENPPPTSPAPVPTQLNAGSVDDNEAWEDYLRYREEFPRPASMRTTSTSSTVR